MDTTGLNRISLCVWGCERWSEKIIWILNLSLLTLLYRWRGLYAQDIFYFSRRHLTTWSLLYRYRGQGDYSCSKETLREYVVFIIQIAGPDWVQLLQRDAVWLRGLYYTGTGARVTTAAPRRRCVSTWSLLYRYRGQSEYSCSKETLFDYVVFIIQVPGPKWLQLLQGDVVWLRGPSTVAGPSLEVGQGTEERGSHSPHWRGGLLTFRKGAGGEAGNVQEE